MENCNNTSSPIVNGDKHSNQLIIKAQLGDDIRKLMINNEDLTLNGELLLFPEFFSIFVCLELVLMMERIFVGKISNSDEITIKYLDDDGDKITLSNDSDLTVALHFHKRLRLFLFINGKEEKNSKVDKQQGDFIDEKTFRSELQDIRTTVQTILDRLKLSSNEVSSKTDQEQKTEIQTETNHQVQSIHEQPPPPPPVVQTAEIPTATSPFTQQAYTQEQQAKTNIFGPPPTTTPPPSTFPNMPPVPTASAPAPRFPPAAHTPPVVSSPPPQQSGFYGQQQNFYQPRPPTTNIQQTNPYPPNPVSAPSFVPQSPPTYPGYPPQNSYYNPVQQYQQ